MRSYCVDGCSNIEAGQIRSGMMSPDVQSVRSRLWSCALVGNIIVGPTGPVDAYSGSTGYGRGQSENDVSFYCYVHRRKASARSARVPSRNCAPSTTCPAQILADTSGCNHCRLNPWSYRRRVSTGSIRSHQQGSTISTRSSTRSFGGSGERKMGSRSGRWYELPASCSWASD